MGQVVGKLQNCSGSVQDVLAGGRKRKRSMDSQNQIDYGMPKRKKLLTTTQYIYRTLFKEQRNSDVEINALNKVWHLHKVYLSQSPYFYSMFNGGWKESTQKYIHIQIIDQHITVESLEAVFGSLYSDEIEIDAEVVVSVLATATFFHLDKIIEKCSEVMVNTINAESAIHYYDASYDYCVVPVKRLLFQWFEINLLTIYQNKENLLRQISIELMTALTGSPDLYVMQTEFSLYTFLRTWMFLRLHPNYDSADPEEVVRAQKTQERLNRSGFQMNSTPMDIAQWTFFTNRVEERSFLATAEGHPYVRTFQKLRTQYLTNHYIDLRIIYNDNIIPKEWMYRHIYTHWHSLLKIDHNRIDGLHAHSPHNVDDEEFSENAMRCCRMLPIPSYQKWRWTGFNFGLDLIFIFDASRLIIRRYHRNGHERMLTLQTKRQFMIRATVTSINTKHEPIYTQSTDIRTLTLEKNEEVELLVLNAKLVHPLLVSVNMLVTPPTDLSYKDIVPLSTNEYGMLHGATSTPESPNESAVNMGESLSSSSPIPSSSQRCLNIWSPSPSNSNELSTSSSSSSSISNYPSSENADDVQQ